MTKYPAQYYNSFIHIAGIGQTLGRTDGRNWYENIALYKCLTCWRWFTDLPKGCQ